MLIKTSLPDRLPGIFLGKMGWTATVSVEKSPMRDAAQTIDCHLSQLPPQHAPRLGQLILGLLDFAGHQSTPGVADAQNLHRPVPTLSAHNRGAASCGITGMDVSMTGLGRRLANLLSMERQFRQILS